MIVGNVRVPSLGDFRRDTRLLLISSGIFSIGFFGVQTLLKVLYVLRLGYGLEYVGIFTATASLVYMAMSFPSGVLGNRFGLKPMMTLGGVLTTAGMFILPMTEAVPAWARDAFPIMSQMALTGGWALLSINLVPALMSATTTRTRDDAYALSGMLRGAGTFAGTILGGILPMMFALLLGITTDGPAPYRWALLLGAALGAIGMVPLIRVRIEEPEDVSVETEAHNAFPFALVAAASLYVMLVNAGFAVCQSYCSAYMDTDLHLSTATIGFLTAIGQFLAILAPVAMPYLGVRRSHAWTLMMVGALSAAVYLPLVFVPTWWAAGLGRTGLLALAALWMPALQVFQMTVIERHWRSLAYGAVSTAMGFAFGTMSLAGGFIAARMGYSSIFAIGSVAAAAGAIVMWMLRRNLAATMFVEEIEEELAVAFSMDRQPAPLAISDSSVSDAGSRAVRS